MKKIFKYLGKTILEKIRVMQLIQISIIPIILFLLEKFCSFFEITECKDFTISWWILLIIAGFLFILYLLYFLSKCAHELEEKNKPKLCILSGDKRIFKEHYPNGNTLIRIGVQNISTVVIHGVNLSLANLFNLNNSEYRDLNIYLNADGEGENKRISLNPGSITYFNLALVEKKNITIIRMPSKIKISSFYFDIRNKDGLLCGEKWKLKLKVSGETSTEIIVYFLIGLTINNELIFEPFKKV